MTKPILEVRGLSKSYRTDGGMVTALQKVSLAVERGTVVAVIGPSGSGKTTLLNLLSGLDRPSTGEVLVAGQPLTGLDSETGADFRRRHIGFVFQFFNLIPTMSVRDNVAIPLLVERLSRRTIAERVEAALAAVSLPDHTDRRASELSGGEMQRVAVARALVMDPPVLLADEPTGNLDSVTGDTILQLICTAGRAAGRAVVLVTHSYLATAYADRVLVMRDGQIVEDTAPREQTRDLHLVSGGRDRRR